MSIDGDGKTLGELNHQLQGETGRFENVVNEDDIKVNDSTENLNYRHERALQAPQAALQLCQQQQLQGSVDCWEKFLHVRSVKVLLVENDYSTRHVVTALLRNCYYEVIEAADGLQAWKMLEDLTIQIDLVLTEVDMPGLSGLGLLYKIMSHKTRKNVPVIMMSSHDSMGLVFKCLSKGAADFLVKPIRKNELKNVWQHVWRRCRSSSGSGSESGTHTQKSVRSKGVEKCDNNTGSSDENDNGSMGLSVGDGSDSVSGNQSSWTKQAVEDSSQSASPEDQIAEGPDSTCAQVIFSNAEVSGNKQPSIIKVKECERCNEQLDDEPDKDEEKVVLGNIDSQFIHLVEDPNSNCVAFPKSTAIEASIRQPTISGSKIKASDDADGTPYFEHGFKRLKEEKDVETNHNVSKRSGSTAFSRKSGRPLDSASGKTDKTRKEPVLDLESHLNVDHPNRFSNVGSYSATKGDLSAPQQILSKNADDAGIRKIQSHLCNRHGMQQPELSPDHPDASLKKMAEKVPHCGSSNVLGGPAEGSGGNYNSDNGSVSGSNHGSNQGSNTVVNNGGINIESGSGDGSGSGIGNRVDQNKLSQREAGLAKFPEKRKERCFQKKVRHQTQKKRGQIVRQTTNESSSEGSES